MSETSSLPTNIDNANLPRTYEAAKTALAECSNIDECQTWADKAAALASYARQSKDESLMRYAVRIRDRAIRRTGELLKQIEPANGARTDLGREPTRGSSASDAGLSPHQAKQAVRVANIPAAQFEALVESDQPPSVTKLAELGTVPKVDKAAFLNGRDPKEWELATQFIGAFESYLTDISEFDIEKTITVLTIDEVAEVRALIGKIDAVNDTIATRI